MRVALQPPLQARFQSPPKVIRHVAEQPARKWQITASGEVRLAQRLQAEPQPRQEVGAAFAFKWLQCFDWPGTQNVVSAPRRNGPPAVEHDRAGLAPNAFEIDGGVRAVGQRNHMTREHGYSTRTVLSCPITSFTRSRPDDTS